MLLLLVFYVFWIAAGGELSTYADFATKAAPKAPAAPVPTATPSAWGSPSATVLNDMAKSPLGGLFSSNSPFAGIFSSWSHALTAVPAN